MVVKLTFTIPPSHKLWLAVVLTWPKGFTVIVVFILQPFEFVYVIIVVPVFTAVTKPVEALIVATAGADETQAPVVAGVPLPVSWVVDPLQTNKVPDIDGSEFTVIIAVFWQPFEFV